MCIKFFRNYLLKMLTFSSVCFDLSVENQMSVVMHTHVWLFNSAPLVYMLIFVSVPYCFCYYDSVTHLEVEWKGGRLEDIHTAYLVYCHIFCVLKHPLKYYQQDTAPKICPSINKNKHFFSVKPVQPSVLCN